MINSQVKKYLTSLTVSKQLEKIASQYKIDRKTQGVIEEIIAKQIEGKSEPAILASELFAQVNMNFAVALNLGFDLYQQMILSAPAELTQLGATAIEPVSLKSLDLTRLLEEIKNTVQIHLPAELTSRFNNLIFLWWRDIRDDLETLDAFNKSQISGGLGLDRPQASNLLNVIKQKEIEYEKKNIDVLALIGQELRKETTISSQLELGETEIDVKNKVQPLVESKEKISGQDVTLDRLLALQERFKQIKHNIPKAKPAVASPLATAIEAEENFLQSTKELAPPPPVAITLPAAPVIKPVVFESQPVAQKAMPEATQTLFKQAAPSINARPRVDDVKFTSQLIGPIDELAVLKIADFRRLSKSAMEAAAKIRSKLDLLEDESMVQRAAGIKALKSSPLYKAYADIMNNSIKEGKSFEDIIASQDTLKLEEFKAIMELNKSLKY